MAKYRYPKGKMVMVPVCLNGGCCYLGYVGIVSYNKDQSNKSLPLLVFRRHIDNVIFLEYSKEVRLSSSHLGIRNIPSNVCYDDTTHYQVQCERRRIQNPYETSKMECFCVNS